MQDITADEQPRYRSAAVARMVRMPVATLRIWERRYQVASPATSPTGHRLYSAQDVRRLGLLRQLTEMGHAIGTLAGMSMAQLHEVATTHASALAQHRQDDLAAPTHRSTPWRVAAVGQGLAQRLADPSLVEALGCTVALPLTCDTLVQTTPQGDPPRVDALLWQTAGLQAADLPRLLVAAQQLGATHTGVLYGYAPAAVCQQFAAAGVLMLRWPPSPATWLDWLRQMAPKDPAPAEPASDMQAAPDQIAPRRYDDATLADLANLSSTMVCECPKHVAELLMLLTQFEAYSAQCANLNAADMVLHQHLQAVAARARALFEGALERVIEHEGLVLPSR